MTDSWTSTLPKDDPSLEGTYVGRVWNPAVGGPCVVRITRENVVDITEFVSTMSALLDLPNPSARVNELDGVVLASTQALIENSWHAERDVSQPWLLSPFDLQVVAGSGVTLIASLLERVVEERAMGDLGAATEIRETITALVGPDLSSVVPGSPGAEEIARLLKARGFWSPYLEVGIGPDAEIFSKAPPLSSVGYGAEVGASALSQWNNSEPEVVLAVSSRGDVVGFTLGNDMNLRDVESRSALLLPRAKDNNAATAVGPWIRLLDADFSMENMREVDLSMTVVGDDGFRFEESARLSSISRPLESLVSQAIGPQHRYPYGLALFTGAPIVPIVDRTVPGMGFTHKIGDVITIGCGALGSLRNSFQTSEASEPWTHGIGAFMRNLSNRGLLESA